MDRLQQLFRSQPHLDAVLLLSWDASQQVDSNFLYLSGSEIDRATFIARRSESPALLCNPLNYELAKETFRGTVTKFEPQEYKKKLNSLLKGAKSIGICKRDISAAFYEALQKGTRAKLVDISDSLLLQRMEKDETEIASIRHACSIARKSLESLYIRPGKTELGLQSELQSVLYSNRSSPSFPPIILFGKNARFPHGKSGNRRLEKGEIVLLDWGARHGNYCSDITRCIFIGEPNKEQEKAYEKLQDVFKEIISFIRPGMPVRKVSAFASEQLKEAGLPQMPHGIGHGIGLDVHEYPSFAKNSKHKLIENSTLAIEPSAYFKNFGARFENTILLKRRATVL